MYRQINTSSPYGQLARYVTPYGFPLPTNNRPAAPASNSAVVSSNVSPQTKSGGKLGQSATGHHHRGWLRGYVNPYGFPLPWAPSNMGDYVSTAPAVAPVVAAPAPAVNTKMLLGIAVLGAVGWFLWKKKKL